ncbi:unnamed protein product [Echinostoma caproni]|uniref:Protein kinase domain-containing protein n=1 Tax=Echinostoma caproni TaxID=27848 RepID=A0A183B392_9TREM|nr:unnamed protein product [Echinostoma caproni]
MYQSNAVCYSWTEYALDQSPTEINHIADNQHVREVLSRLQCHLRVERDYHPLGSQIRVLVAAPDAKKLVECNRTLERILPQYCTRNPCELVIPLKNHNTFKPIVKLDWSGDHLNETVNSEHSSTVNYWTGSCGERKKVIRFSPTSKQSVKRIKWALTHNTRHPITPVNPSTQLSLKWNTARSGIYPRVSRWPSVQCLAQLPGDRKAHEADLTNRTGPKSIGRNLARIKATHTRPFSPRPTVRRSNSLHESFTTLIDISEPSLDEERHGGRVRVRESVSENAIRDGTNSNMNMHPDNPTLTDMNSAPKLSDLIGRGIDCSGWPKEGTKENTIGDSLKIKSWLGDSANPSVSHESSLKRSGNGGRNTSKDFTAFTTEECDSNPSSWDVDKEKGNYSESEKSSHLCHGSSKEIMEPNIKIQQYLSNFIGDRPQRVLSPGLRRAHSTSHSCMPSTGRLQRNLSQSYSASPKLCSHHTLPRNPSPSMNVPVMRAAKSACALQTKISPQQVQFQHAAIPLRPPKRFIRMNEVKRGNTMEYSTGGTLAGAHASHDVATQFVVTRTNSAQMDAIFQTSDDPVPRPRQSKLIESYRQEVNSLCQLSPASRNDHPMDHIHPATVEIRPHVCQVPRSDALNVEIGQVPVTISSRTVPAYGARSYGVQVDWLGPIGNGIPVLCHCCYHGPGREWNTSIIGSSNRVQSYEINSIENTELDGPRTEMDLTVRGASVDGTCRRISNSSGGTQRENQPESIPINQTDHTSVMQPATLPVPDAVHSNRTDNRPKSNPCDRVILSSLLDGTGFVDLKAGSTCLPSDLTRVIVLASGENKEISGTECTTVSAQKIASEVDVNRSETEPIGPPRLIDNPIPELKQTESDEEHLVTDLSHAQPSSWSIDSSRLRISTVGRRVKLYRPLCMSKAFHRADRVYSTGGVITVTTTTPSTTIPNPKPETRVVSPAKIQKIDKKSQRLKSPPVSRSSVHRQIQPADSSRSDAGSAHQHHHHQKHIETQSTDKRNNTNISKKAITVVTANPFYDGATSSIHVHTRRSRSTRRTALREQFTRPRLGCQAPKCIAQSIAASKTQSTMIRTNSTSTRTASILLAPNSRSSLSTVEPEPPRVRRRTLSRPNWVNSLRNFHESYSRFENRTTASNPVSITSTYESGSTKKREKWILPWNQSPHPNSHRRPKPVFDTTRSVSRALTNSAAQKSKSAVRHTEQNKFNSIQYGDLRRLVDSYLARANKNESRVAQEQTSSRSEADITLRQTTSSQTNQPRQRKSFSLPGTPVQRKRINERKIGPTGEHSTHEPQQQQQQQQRVSRSLSHMRRGGGRPGTREIRKHSPLPARSLTRNEGESVSSFYHKVTFDDQSGASTLGHSSCRNTADRWTTDDAASSEIRAVDERLGVALQGTLDRILFDSADQLTTRCDANRTGQTKQSYFSLGPFLETGTADLSLSDTNNDPSGLNNEQSCVQKRGLLEKTEAIRFGHKPRGSGVVDKTRIINQNSQTDLSSALWCCAPWRRVQTTCSQ